MKKQFVPMLLLALLAVCVLMFADVKTGYNSTDFSRPTIFSRADLPRTESSGGWLLSRPGGPEKGAHGAPRDTLKHFPPEFNV